MPVKISKSLVFPLFMEPGLEDSLYSLVSHLSQLLKSRQRTSPQCRQFELSWTEYNNEVVLVHLSELGVGGYITLRPQDSPKSTGG